ncbi:MAG: peptidase M29, partial [Burkholderiales bacterium]
MTASVAIGGITPVVAALGQAGFVVDCTLEGLMHAPETPAILKAGARVLMVSNEHPEALERLLPTEEHERKVKAGIKRLRGAKRMHVTSRAGTDLVVDVAGAMVGVGWGYT